MRRKSNFKHLLEAFISSTKPNISFNHFDHLPYETAASKTTNMQKGWFRRPFYEREKKTEVKSKSRPILNWSLHEFRSNGRITLNNQRKQEWINATCQLTRPAIKIMFAVENFASTTKLFHLTAEKHTIDAGEVTYDDTKKNHKNTFYKIQPFS